MDNRTILVKQGKLVGRSNFSSFSQKTYYSFLGIPYAEPPIGSLRFQPPVPVNKWSKVLDAKEHGNVCIQYDFKQKRIIGSEDCLYINICTPQHPSTITTPKAVLVQFHGGAYVFGSGLTDEFCSPEFLIHHDVICVSFNFRLHVLGFLDLQMKECRGNMGMKDTVLALKWIKENIAAFGGDPNNITAIGTSSGSCMIHLIMISPMSRGLINKVILQGGDISDPSTCFEQDPITVALEYSRLLGFKGDDKKLKLLYLFLKKQPAYSLAEPLHKFLGIMAKLKAGTYGRYSFIPSIEVNPDGAFLPKSPFQLIDSYEPVPTMYGVCSKEAKFMFLERPLELLQNQFKETIQRIYWTKEMDDEVLNEVCDRIKSFYFHKQEINIDLTSNVLDMYTDILKSGVYEMLVEVIHNQNTETPIYMYRFDFINSRNFMTHVYDGYMPKNIPGPAHADDLFYRIPWIGLFIDERAHKMINIMTSYICNFSKTGDSNGDGLPEWDPVTPDHYCYLSLNDESKMIDGRINGERWDFFRNLSKYIKSKQNKIL